MELLCVEDGGSELVAVGLVDDVIRERLVESREAYRMSSSRSKSKETTTRKAVRGLCETVVVFAGEI